MGLTYREQWTGGYRLTDSADARRAIRSEWDDNVAPSGIFLLADGTGDNQANSVFEAAFTIAATTMQLYDLKGGNGEKDALNVTLAMTKVKGVAVVLTTAPAAGVSVRFGPQNQTDAAQLWFQAATANFYQEVRSRMMQFDPVSGWALDATHKVIALYNPGASAVSGFLRVVGCK